MRGFIAGIAIAVVAFAVGVGAQRKTNTLYGAGSLTCGEWVANAEVPDLRQLSTQWVLGYVSGMGQAFDAFRKDSPLHKLNDSSVDAMELWMDNYCRAHPLKHVHEGATDLVVELMPGTK